MLTVQDEAILERRIKALVTPALLSEAAARPFGPYSAELIEVLDFVRRNPDPEKPRYLIVALEGGGFAVSIRSPRPGEAPRAVGGVLPDRAAAEHEVLRRRLSDYGVEL